MSEQLSSSTRTLGHISQTVLWTANTGIEATTHTTHTMASWADEVHQTLRLKVLGRLQFPAISLTTSIFFAEVCFLCHLFLTLVLSNILSNNSLKFLFPAYITHYSTLDSHFGILYQNKQQQNITNDLNYFLSVIVRLCKPLLSYKLYRVYRHYWFITQIAEQLLKN